MVIDGPATRAQAAARLAKALGSFVEVTRRDGERRQGHLEDVRGTLLLLADKEGLPDTVDLLTASEVRILGR